MVGEQLQPAIQVFRRSASSSRRRSAGSSGTGIDGAARMQAIAERRMSSLAGIWSMASRMTSATETFRRFASMAILR